MKDDKSDDYYFRGAESKEEDITVGSVVRLKSGGPSMTVEAIELKGNVCGSLKGMFIRMSFTKMHSKRNPFRPRRHRLRFRLPRAAVNLLAGAWCK